VLATLQQLGDADVFESVAGLVSGPWGAEDVGTLVAWGRMEPNPEAHARLENKAELWATLRVTRPRADHL